MKTRVRVSRREALKIIDMSNLINSTLSPDSFELEAEVIEEKCEHHPMGECPNCKKSDEEILRDFLGSFHGSNSMLHITRCLLSSKAINPDFLDSLRKGEK